MVWQPTPNLKNVYLYRQLELKNDVVYKYFDVQNVKEISDIIINELDPNKRNFGEVVTYGELYCIIAPPKDEYTIFSVVVEAVLRKYITNKITRITHTKYVNNRMDYEYYIFRIATDKGVCLYWEMDDMKKIIGAICHHIDHTHGQHSGVYQQVDDYTLKIPIQDDIYLYMQHMMLPDCVNIEKKRDMYTVKEANSSICINLDNRLKWEKVILSPDTPSYVHGIPISSKEIFESVMAKHTIHIMEQAPWLGEYYVTSDICPISGKSKCQSKIRLTSKDIKLYCKCDEALEQPECKVLHTFEMSQVKRRNVEITTFDDYLELNHHSTRYVDALIALKRVLIYDIGARKIAIKKRNDSTSEIYWEYWEDTEFFSTYKRKVKNHKGEFASLSSVIEYQAHEFKTRIVWVPYSWKYKPDDFDKYSECVNQYPVPKDPKLETYADKFQLELVNNLFAGNLQEASAFALLLAKIVQKPHCHKKFHIILKNAGSYVIIDLLTALLGKEVIYFTNIENLDNVPKCTVCVIENYSKVTESQKIRSNATKFFYNRVFNRPNYSKNPHELYNNCYAISLYHDDGIPAKQKKEFCDEVVIDMHHTYAPLNMDGAYEYILSIEEREYEGIEDRLARCGFIEEPKSMPALTTTAATIEPLTFIMSSDDPTSTYFNAIFQHKREAVTCGNAYPVNEVYDDYVQ